MRDQYLDEVISRGGELARLEKAALSLHKKPSSTVRWIVAAAFGTAVALFPSVCSANAFLQMI